MEELMKAQEAAGNRVVDALVEAVGKERVLSKKDEVIFAVETGDLYLDEDIRTEKELGKHIREWEYFVDAEFDYDAESDEDLAFLAEDAGIIFLTSFGAVFNDRGLIQYV